MSNPIKEARAEVAAVLATVDGLAVHQFVPTQLEAPAAVITFGEPYLAAGKALGEDAVTLGVRLYANGENDFVTETLDQLLYDVTKALRTEFGYVQASVGYDQESYAPAIYLVADITMNQINYSGGNN